MSKKFKIIRPKPCVVDADSKKLELQPVGKIVDADNDHMLANMERFVSMGWAMEVKLDSVEETVEVEAEVEIKRARNEKGHLVGDDKSTPDVNEAWEGGEAPKKKTTAKKKTTKKTTKKASS
jgi:hypothetical protein